MRLALHLVMYLLALSMSAGWVELVEEGAHLLVAGPSDCREGDCCEGEEQCDDQGCTPASHHCGCCASLVMAPPTNGARVRRAEHTLQIWAAAVPAAGPSGVHHPLERPPSV